MEIRNISKIYKNLFGRYVVVFEHGYEVKIISEKKYIEILKIIERGK